MADQQVTIDYTIPAKGNFQQIDVNLVLTYDDAQKRSKVDQKNDAYKVTGASGTYTTTDSKGVTTTHEITGVKERHHLGNDDNLIIFNGKTIVDRHGITFQYLDPVGRSKAGQAHTKSVNLFLNPQAGKGTIEQYTSLKSRKVEGLTLNGQPTATSSTTSNAEADTAATMCFDEGTLIRTMRGDVAVEELRVGDLAITATGEARPIKWLGHRDLDLRGRPSEAMPVRIAAHAFGPDMPARDLTLSPGHPVLVGADADNEGGHLVPIMCLVNGTTIERVSVPGVAYWHVELESHDVLLAEGLPAESYIAYGDHTFFTREADDPLANPDLVLAGLGGRCRPVAIDGVVVERERERLDTRFATRLDEACSWPNVDARLDF